MSHVVSIQTKVRDPAAITAACRRLNLAEPSHGTARLYSDQATGTIVKLPGWKYPVVIQTDGTTVYDNFQGHWGDQRQLDEFLQIYAVEAAKLEARRKGLAVNEQALADGSIKLQIIQHD